MQKKIIISELLFYFFEIVFFSFAGLLRLPRLRSFKPNRTIPTVGYTICRAIDYSPDIETMKGTRVVHLRRCQAAPDM